MKSKTDHTDRHSYHLTLYTDERIYWYFALQVFVFWGLNTDVVHSGVVEEPAVSIFMLGSHLTQIH
jgi:hypothetical protein